VDMAATGTLMRRQTHTTIIALERNATAPIQFQDPASDIVQEVPGGPHTPGEQTSRGLVVVRLWYQSVVLSCASSHCVRLKMVKKHWIPRNCTAYCRLHAGLTGRWHITASSDTGSCRL
jgi:hypothetical protein